MANKEVAAADRHKAIEQRSKELAADAGEQAAAEARSRLLQYPDLFSAHELIEKYAAREYQRAYDTTLAARAVGRYNDVGSTAAGMTVYLTIEAAVNLQQSAKHSGAPWYLHRYAQSLHPVGDGSRLYEMELPQDGFYAGSVCRIFGEATWSPYGDGASNCNYVLDLAVHDVVRIEGYSGELWQNPDFTAQGVPVPKS